MRENLEIGGNDAFEELYGLSDEIVGAVQSALEGEASDSNQDQTLRNLCTPLHAADLADLIEHLGRDERVKLVRCLGDAFDAESLSEMDYTVRLELVEALPIAKLASMIVDLESDDAVNIIEDLEEEEQQLLLAHISAADRAIYEQSLSWPEESAGRIMRREAVTVPNFWTVGQTIDFIRVDEGSLPEHFYNIMVVGPEHKPVGMLPLSRLLRTRRVVPLASVMEQDMKLLSAEINQEDAVFLFRQYALVEAPVVDDAGRLVGVVTVDDIVDIMDEEHEDDILKLGGVAEDDFYSDFIKTTRSRFSWLAVNLGTAILASLVIALFDVALEKVVALAILMPIVASMGGNAGTQTLTVSVRALATNELTSSNVLRTIGKEILVGGTNGILFAFIMGAIAWIWFQSPVIGAIIAGAMIVNLLIASMAGAAIPFFLQKMEQDPAVSSSVFLTTITDVVGFFVFLGLASLVLL